MVVGGVEGTIYVIKLKWNDHKWLLFSYKELLCMQVSKLFCLLY
jgi:hypothetical protein